MGAGVADLLAAPVIALAAVGLLALVSRWTVGRSRTPPRACSVPDYGLLEAVETHPDPESAERACRLLAAQHIRVTIGPVSTDPLSPSRAGYVVLVFPADAERARALLAG